VGLDPPGDVFIRRTAVGRVVLEAATIRRIVRGGNDDAVRQPAFAATVVREYGVRNHGCGCVFIPVRKHDFHTVGRQHLKRAGQRRLRKRMRVDAQEQRAIDTLLLAVGTNGLTDGQHMPFVKAGFE
jgi:hypothetical protein